MILKEADSKESRIAELERQTASASGDQKTKFEQDLRILRAGLKGEREAAYFIDFDYRDSQNLAVIHDLRLELNGRVAQIDHLVINRLLDCFVLETKHFHGGLKITEDGDFLRWNNYSKTYEGMASPLTQNERHITVLADAFKQIDMPTRLGIRLMPAYYSYVLVSVDARVDRPRHFDTSRVIKADGLKKAIDSHIDKMGYLDTLKGAARLVSSETLREVGLKLAALHRPLTIKAPKVPTGQLAHEPRSVACPPIVEQSVEFACRGCKSTNLSIQPGKYGYYFKCSDCGGNTPAKVSCGEAGHKERLRKEGAKFFRECTDCKSSSLYFENPAGK